MTDTSIASHPISVNGANGRTSTVAVGPPFEAKSALRRRLARWLVQLTDDAPPTTSRCRACGGEAIHAGSRAIDIRTLAGTVQVWRATYRCRDCGSITIPFDERLDPAAALARLRQRIKAGQTLAIDELASDWDLGRAERPKAA